MAYPQSSNIVIENQYISFYIEPGQTLAMTLEWDDFLRRKYSNILFQGPTAEINRERAAFNAQLPEHVPYPEYSADYERSLLLSPGEYRLFFDSLTSGYSAKHKMLMETIPLSDKTKELIKYEYLTALGGRNMSFERS
jgi:hypothetical protein